MNAFIISFAVVFGALTGGYLFLVTVTIIQELLDQLTKK